MMQINIAVSTGFDSNSILLELYQNQIILGSLTLFATENTDFEYESEVQEPWVEAYLWQYWVTMIHTVEFNISVQ
jgi:hypothetical protein